MGGMTPAGTIQPEPSGARPKRPRGFSRGPERETSESEAGVAARLMRRDGRSSGARLLRVGAVCLSLRWQTNQSFAFNGCTGSRRGAAWRTVVFISTERGAVSIFPHPVIQPKSPSSFTCPKWLGSFFLWWGLISMSAEEGRWFSWWPLVRVRTPWPRQSPRSSPCPAYCPIHWTGTWREQRRAVAPA